MEGVRTCPNCGEEVPVRFPLCGFCGLRFPDAEARPETRKTVTVLFCDLKGSTPLGEALDPESLREVITRYFDEMRGAIEMHGGSIEKFIGDAIMAVFGVPKVREDDALRAVRAAAEMQRRFAVLNEELQRRWDVRLSNRTGINTGELVAGDPVAGQRLVVGDSVNVAARLEQTAPADEVLIGEPTWRLVRNAVDVEELEPLELKGKSEAVRAFRLVAVREEEALTRHHDRPIVGRERELATIREALASAARDSRARMASVLADAGMGKSRLVRAVADAVAPDARVVAGRCLPYGQGITFWPLVEIVRGAGGIADDDPVGEALAKLEALAPADRAVTARVASAVGLSDAQFPLDELRWGIRKLLELLASERPLVVVFDDVHWAESTMLDLIVHLAESAEAPMLLLCLARHELAERRPDWPEPRMSLEPLTDEEMGRVVENALGRGEMAGEVRKRILAAAGGNPLFVEQMLSMLVDEGTLALRDGCWKPTVPLSEVVVPPSIQALLTARIDHLGRDERGVIEPASVVGQVFPQSAVEWLVHERRRETVGEGLEALTTKQLVRPDRAALGTDDGYRFQHILIKEAVYRRLLKRTRATLHERLVDWAEEFNRSRGRELEFEELNAYHLEQAHRYLSELGPLDEHGRSLGLRAAERLSSAGRRAFARGDMPAAANLLRRATGLLPAASPARLALLPDLAEALVDVGEFSAAEDYLAEAAGSRNERVAARAEVVRLQLAGQAGDPGAWADQAVRRVEELLPAFARTGDDVGSAAAYRLLAWAHGTACRYEEAAAAALNAVRHADAAADERQHRRAAAQYAVAAVWGPTPVPEAITYCRELIESSSGDRRTRGLVTSLLARLEAMSGDFESARRLAREGRAMLQEMGRTVVAASTSLDSCGVEMLAGDPAAAERELARDYEELDAMGEKYLLSTIAAERARALAEDDRNDEAEHWTRVSQELTVEDDTATQALWRSVRARALTRRGEIGQALALAREANALLEPSDSLIARADALVALAEVLTAAGRHAEARRAATDAITLYERKGDRVSVARTASLPWMLVAEPLAEDA